MEKMPIIKRIIHIIINFFKMLILYIIDFVLYLFGRENKNIKKEIIIVTKDIKHGKVTLRDGDYNVPIDPSSLVSDPGNKPEEILKRKEHVIYKHISNQYDGNVKMFIVTEEMINLIIDEYIEEKEEIQIKKFDKEKTKIYELWKDEIILPKVKKELEKTYIENKDILEKCVIEIVDEELELEKKKVEEVKEVIKDNKDVEIKTIVINNKEDIIVDFHDELVNTNIELSENITYTTPIIDNPSIELKNEVVDILESSSLILSNVEHELILDNNEIENITNEVSTEDNIVLEDIDDIKLDNEDNDIIEDTDIEVKNKDENNLTKLEEIKEIVNKNIDIKKEDVIEVLDNKVSKKDIEVIEQVIEIKKEQTEIIKEQEVILQNIRMPDVNINEDNIENKVNNERYKEDIEDRDYDALEEKINEAIEKISNFILLNEKKLTNAQLIQLEKQKERLELVKDKINRQREYDIEAEKRELEANIHRKEINGLQQHLLNIHLDNQIDITNNLINKLEDLNNISPQKARQIEKKLIKQKLRKACNSTSYPSLFTLPFIRNKYFLFFTGSLIVNRHLSFIGDVFRRQSSSYQDEELSNLLNGRDSLNEALNKTRDNLDYLSVLEIEAIRRYPELKKDSEYLHYVGKLKRDLNRNYKRLNRRHDFVDKLIYKNKNKVLKKINNKYYKNVA